MLIHANVLVPAMEQFAWIKHDMPKICYKIKVPLVFCDIRPYAAVVFESKMSESKVATILQVSESKVSESKVATRNPKTMVVGTICWSRPASWENKKIIAIATGNCLCLYSYNANKKKIINKYDKTIYKQHCNLIFKNVTSNLDLFV